jgi:hypothetical protein
MPPDDESSGDHTFLIPHVTESQSASTPDDEWPREGPGPGRRRTSPPDDESSGYEDQARPRGLSATKRLALRPTPLSRVGLSTPSRTVIWSVKQTLSRILRGRGRG